MKGYRGGDDNTSLYKICTTALAERLREEVEGKGLIQSNQMGFRKGMITMNNIYTLNYLVNRQIEKKEKKMTVVFVADLKAAFDSIDRRVLIRFMKERGKRGINGEDGGNVKRGKE